MTRPGIAAYIQARMSSQRFPGKVLAPLRGQPLVWHVLAAVAHALPDARLVVVTSEDRSDDPLVAYLESLEVAVFRGPLANVFERFRGCAARHPAEWILRISADSPLIRPRVLRAVAEADRADCDLVTTIFPRTWPKGQNAELIRAGALLGVSAEVLSAADTEHVTTYFYRHASSFRILNVTSPNPSLADLQLAVDTVDDLRRLEGLDENAVDAVLAGTSPPAALTGDDACLV